MPAKRNKKTETPTAPPLMLADGAKRNLVIKALLTLCIVSLLMDIGFIVSPVITKHEHVKWESWPGFYAVFGFLSCITVVLTARFLVRPVVERKEDFYDD